MAIAFTLEQINKLKPDDSRLTAISFATPIPNGKNFRRTVLCKCVCNRYKVTEVALVVSGHTRSCGCLFKEVLLRNITKYNPIIPALHKQYKHMMQRCYNPNNNAYKYYGAQGVIVCDEWKGKYQNFLNWALANGWRRGLQIDKDKKIFGCKLYSPETCSFLTARENNQYRRKRGTALL